MPQAADAPVRILLIEDNPGDARLLELTLEEAEPAGYQLLRATRLADALGRLAADPVDLVLVDLGLPDSQGLDSCARVVAAAPDAAVVVMTGWDDGGIALAALAAGAQDYLVKGQADGPLLARALRYALERKRITADRERLLREKEALVAQLEQANRELEASRARQAELAVRDPLTGLYNRRELDRFLHEELTRMTRFGHSVVFLILDLDHFKTINDTWGHPFGDQVLTLLARRLECDVRPMDRLVRYGGEEFAIIAPMLPPAEGLALAERIRAGVAARPFLIDRADGITVSVPLTVSLGLACAPNHAQDAEGLLAVADAALYEAKHRGRNQVHVGAENLLQDPPGNAHAEPRELVKGD